MLSTVCIMGKLGSIPIRDGKGNRLMGIMATFCSVHIVMATEKNWVLSVLSVAVAATVNVSFSCWHWPRTFNQPNAQ